MSEHTDTASGARRRAGFGSPNGADPAEAGRRSGAVRRGEVTPEQNLLLRAMLKNGGTQGLASIWRMMERERGEAQLTVGQLEERQAELEAAIADLEAERTRLAALLESEQGGVREAQRELRRLRTEHEQLERDLEHGLRITSDEELLALLRDLGEERAADAMIALGWAE
jgi:chromosome segregation ATPase